MTEPHDDTEQVRRVFFAPGVLENDKAFRDRLATLTHTGLQWGGAVGLVGVLVLVLVHWGVLGRPTTWGYPASMSADVFVLWDKAVVVGVCLGAVGLGRSRCRLSVGRAGGTALALVAAVVSLTHDAYRGILSVEYLVLVYLLAVAVLPYRPWQALLFGLVLTGVFYGLGHYGWPGTAAARPGLVTGGHLVRMAFASVVLTGVSGVLYHTRYRQHRARRTAEALHEQVADLERAKSRFFADVADEFRGPLTLLMGATREVRDGRFGEVPNGVRERVAFIDGQAQRMRRLVDQLRELTAVDEGHLSLSMQEHDLAGLLRRWVPPFRQWGTGEGVTVEVEIEPDRCPVWMDAERIGDVLGEVLSNAIRYTPEGGHVRLRLQAAADTVAVSVRDTGPGLPEGLQARVFAEGDGSLPVGDAEEDRSIAEQWLGMGIGLAHARAVVRRHGGAVAVESEPGFGTEVTVRLPLGDDHVAPDDVADGGAEAPRQLERGRQVASYPRGEGEEAAPDDAPTLLVVDGNAEMRSYLQSLLRPSYHVEVAADGDAALGRLREGGVDLVVSDAVLPGRDGRALCRAIREDERLRHLPVVLLTTQPAEGRQAEGRPGADAHVVKPFPPDELEVRIENLIEIRRILQTQMQGTDERTPAASARSDEEAAFLNALHEVVDEHIDNSNFGVDWLADEMDLSARHLRRRVKEVTRLSPAGFIRTRRLQHAATLLVEGADTVSEVASAVGYRDPSYFSRLFQDTFGCSPSEYAEEYHEPPDWSDIPEA